MGKNEKPHNESTPEKQYENDTFKGLRLNEKHHSVMLKTLLKPPPLPEDIWFQSPLESVVELSTRIYYRLMPGLTVS